MMNILNSTYKYIIGGIAVIIFLFLLMSKFGKNEKVVLNENIKPDTLEKIEKDISSNMISNEKPNVDEMEKKQKKKPDNRKLSDTKKIKEDKKKQVKIKQKTRTNLFVDPVETVNELHKGLKEINFSNGVTRLNEIKSVIHRTYNSSKMTKMIIGKDWESIKAEKQNELIEVMEEYIASNYVSRFSKIKDVNFENINVKKIKNGYNIVSTFLKFKDDSINIDYLFELLQVSPLPLSIRLKEFCNYL